MLFSVKHVIHMSLLVVTFALVSCGKGSANQFVKSVSVSTKDIDGDDWVSLNSVIEIAGAQVPAITLPIVDPRNPSDVYGKIALSPVLGSMQSNVELSVNLSRATGLANSDYATLPNGNNLPFSVPAGIDVIELDIPQISSKIYLALGPQTVMFGYALALKEFDVVARYLPGANIFMGFNIGPVRGNAGVFTSTESGKSGLALFADIGQVVYPQPTSTSFALSKSMSSVQEPILFQQSQASNAQLAGLKKSMNYLKGKKLRLQ
jgi:hypothetical protein